MVNQSVIDSSVDLEQLKDIEDVYKRQAPETAFGLFLNLPEGSAPWNPGTSIA